MFSSPDVAITIFGMAVVTYLTRISGFFLVNRFQVKGRLESFIKMIPGTILISVIAPTVFSAEPAEIIAAVITAVTAWRTKNLAITMAFGVASVYLLRHLI